MHLSTLPSVHLLGTVPTITAVVILYRCTHSRVITAICVRGLVALPVLVPPPGPQRHVEVPVVVFQVDARLRDRLLRFIAEALQNGFSGAVALLSDDRDALLQGDAEGFDVLDGVAGEHVHSADFHDRNTVPKTYSLQRIIRLYFMLDDTGI